MKKIISIIVAAVMMMTAMSVSVGAATIFDTAKSISSGKTVKTEVGRLESADYKVKVTKSGTLTVKYTASMNVFSVLVMDSDGAYVEVNSVEGKTGYHNDYDTSIGVSWSKSAELAAGTATYKVTKGTYYIRVKRGVDGGGWSGGDGSLSLNATFPSETVNKITYLQITVPKGETLKLGAVISGSGTVTWSSSKPSVATVSSKGLITAKSKGFTIITAKLGSSSVKIRIKVTS